MEGQTDAGNGNKRRREDEGRPLPAGGGVSIMAGVGQSISNVQTIAAAIKVYDGGVVSGDLTLSGCRDWAATMRDCEDTVATPNFWGQIATYLPLVYTWTEEKHLVADTALGYLRSCSMTPGHILTQWVGVYLGQAKRVNSSCSKVWTILKRRGGGFDCSPT